MAELKTFHKVAIVVFVLTLCVVGLSLFFIISPPGKSTDSADEPAEQQPSQSAAAAQVQQAQQTQQVNPTHPPPADSTARESEAQNSHTFAAHPEPSTAKQSLEQSSSTLAAQQTSSPRPSEPQASFPPAAPVAPVTPAAPTEASATPTPADSVSPASGFGEPAVAGADQMKAQAASTDAPVTVAAAVSTESAKELPMSNSIELDGAKVVIGSPTPAGAESAQSAERTASSAPQPSEPVAVDAEDSELPAEFADRTEAELAAWKEFKLEYGKKYPGKEESLRRQAVFLANRRFIGAFNERTDRLYKLAVNQFADLTREEINHMFIGPQTSWQETIEQLGAPLPPPMRILSDSAGSAGAQWVDWRNVSAEVVNQAICRDSAVFAAVASLEGAHNALAMGARPELKPLKLSERQLIDCLGANRAPTQAPVCAGLTKLVQVFGLLQGHPAGLAGEQQYAQSMAADSQATFCVGPPASSQPEQTRVRLAAFGLVHTDNIPDALVNSGPLAVAVDASQSSFHFYSSGLYHDDACSADSYNLHVLLVGLVAAEGSEASASGSYLVRASLGRKWGEGGYMRMLRDAGRNKCLPQHFAVYPNLAQ